MRKGVWAVVLLLSIPIVLGAPQVYDEWNFASETSAIVYWQSTEPTHSYIEYGTSSASHGSYASMTSRQVDPWITQIGVMTMRGFSSHFHRIKGLSRNTTYYYRLVMVDAVTGQETVSNEKTFSTHDYSSKRDIETLSSCTFTSSLFPSDITRYEYCITTPGTYILTRDVSVSQGGIYVQTSNVIIDLDGHSLTYNNITGENPNGRTGVFINSGSINTVRVLNGVYIQGTGNGTGNVAWECANCGHNPLLIAAAGSTIEISGNTVDWYGAQVAGINAFNGGDSIHHNFVNDRGTIILSLGGGHVEYRDRLPAAIRVPDDVSNVHHNIINRTRHTGIAWQTGTGVVYNNEIYGDSWATNSELISIGTGTTGYDVYNNKVYGLGYGVEGIYIHANARNAKIHDNYVNLYGSLMYGAGRYAEFGDISSVVGMRMFWGAPQNVSFYNNTIVVTGVNNSRARGIFVMQTSTPMDLKIFNNTIISYGDAVSDVSSLRPTRDTPPLASYTYSNNYIASDICNIAFGDDPRFLLYKTIFYFGPQNLLIENNTIERLGNNPAYHTMRIGDSLGSSATYQMINNVLRDNDVVNGANMGDFYSIGFDNINFTVEWTLAIHVLDSSKNPLNADLITITRNDGAVYQANNVNSLTTSLKELYGGNVAGTATRFNISYNPYVIAVTKGGITQNQTLSIRRKTELNFTFSSCGNQVTSYDTNPCNGCINNAELNNAITDWYADTISMGPLLANIKAWKFCSS